MTVQRMDNVGIVLEDLDAAITFFAELGLELEGRMAISEPWAAKIVGLDSQELDVATMRTPDGHSKLELMSFRSPQAIRTEPHPAPPNALGIRRLMFAVDDIDEVIARLSALGAELMGEVGQFENLFRLCYLRGPEGIMVALAERIG
ncbi:VOC family protein [Nocardia sp. 2]|uniref:VOC family protein n=1 Tax=Nocardia acididurans TaxID=2802282 RepID=A0ABS1MI31_9NOCA|nr:VOC family protein [Nocardia acididurans]MBL1079695.1 VOC family protein [Nocardia acididurans]